MNSSFLRRLEILAISILMFSSSLSWAAQSVAPQMDSEGIEPWQHEIMMDAIELYRPLALEKNFRLRMRVVPHEFLAASAENLGNGVLQVSIGQGLLKSPRLTPDVFRLILCHEVGHLLGGDPKLPLPAEWDGPRAQDGGSLLSSEGQSDFYSSAVCFRRLARTGAAVASLPLAPESLNLANQPAPLRVRDLCLGSWGSSHIDRKICERAALAGLGFLTLVANFNVSLESREEFQSSRIIVDTYPTRQCRLDTIVAGALCRADLPLDLGKVEDLDRRCQDEASRRPRCWYKR